MGDGPIGTEGDWSDDRRSVAASDPGDVVTLRQDPLGIAAIGAEQIPFELAVFRRVDCEHVDVMVWGMWSGDTPVLASYEAGETVTVRVLGVDDERCDPQPYRVVLRVDAATASAIEVRGTRHSERVGTADLDEVPVVCGADPSMAGLAEPFLHCRGARLVLVEPNRHREVVPARRSSITLVA